ncbi:EpsG family protein [uncultured Fibrobacter sp.]|uniref:EpsG family protein n=1 Tax=uncultured Fibrobacter sp. TaxID=261512 RepID=UPI00345A99BB
MLVYLGMALLTFLMASFIKDRPCFSVYPIFTLKKKNIIFLFLILPSVLISGLRFQVGTDYLVYLGRYHYIGSVFAGQPVKMEPLFRVVAEIGRFFSSEQMVFFIIAAIFSFFSYRFIVENSKDVGMSCLLFLFSGFFSLSENLMRQMLGVAICLYALKYVYTSDFKRYLFYVVVASLFHSMSAIFLPMYFLYKRSSIFKKKWTGLFFAVCICLSGVAYKYAYSVMFFLGIKYINYYGSIRDTGSSRIVIVTTLAVLIFSFIFSSPSAKDFKQNIFMMYFIFFALYFLLLNLPNGNRVAFMFIPVEIVLLPNVIAGIKHRLMRNVFKWSLVIFFAGFWFYYFYVAGVGETFPYKSVL